MMDHSVNADADRIAAALMGGQIVLLPTDTVIGLAACPTQAEAVARVFDLKARARSKNLPIMIAAQDQIDMLGGIANSAVEKMLSSGHMPGPLTVALGVDATRAPDWLQDREEIAFRIPNDALLLAVLRRTGPLLVTSANRSGQETPNTTEAALAQLNGTPDVVVAGVGRGSQPSTLVNCRVTPARIERLGAVSENEIATILEGLQ